MNRSTALDAVAHDLGLRFQPEGDLIVQHELPALRLFRAYEMRGAPRALNFLHGEWDGHFVFVFDFDVVDRDRKEIDLFTVVAVRFRGRSLPDFEIYPEGWLDQGMKDFDFSSHPQFSKLYRLHGREEQPVRDHFHPQVLEWFEAHPGLHLEGEGEWIAGYWKNPKKGFFGSPLIAPDDVRSYLRAVVAAAKTIAGA